MFFALTRYKTVLETMLLWEQFLRVFGKQASESVFSLAQIKLFSILITDYFH